MPFFRNSAVNLLNLHYGIHCLALSGGDAFFLVYLLKAGIPIPAVLLSLALILLGRFAIRPLVVVAALRWGLRTLVVAGTLLSAAVYPLLAEVHGTGIALVALIIMAAIGGTVYWTTYHAMFARLGDDEHRGQQIGAREALAAAVSIVSPLMTGWLLVTFGARSAFGTTGVIAAFAALPLLWTPDAAVRPHVSGVIRAAIPATLLFATDGWIATGNVFVWQIALFVSLHESVLGYGGALALAALVGAAGGMTLGRHIDAGGGRHAVWYALTVMALMVVLRAAAAGHAALAVLAASLGSLGYCVYIPTVMTPVYTMAKRSACTLRFHVATEGGWDLGGAAALLTAALALALHVSLSATIMLALPGIVAMAAMLRHYYARAPALADAARPDAARH